MIEKAGGSRAQREWRVADIAAWAAEPDGERFDVVFSNAALHWVDAHATLFPELLARVAPGGALAVQMPAYEMPPNRLMREIAAELGVSAKEWRSHELGFYYEALQPHTARLDLWATEYVQVMPSVEAIVEWYKGTGLRSYLDAVGEEARRERFLEEFGRRLRGVYTESAAGEVMFPFRRVFVVAYEQ